MGLLPPPLAAFTSGSTWFAIYSEGGEGWFYKGACMYVPLDGFGNLEEEVATECPDFSGYKTSVDTNSLLPAFSTRNTTALAAASCKASANCKGFNSFGAMFTRLNPTTEQKGACLYTRE
jgi:hypothetical protein